jgi:hypothetical protein
MNNAELTNVAGAAAILSGGPHQKQLGDVKIAAEILGVSESFLNKKRMTGDGPPYVKLGGSVRYILPELLPWALSRARTSTSDPGRAE